MSLLSAACGLTVRSCGTWHQLKQANNVRGSTGEGDGHIRHTELICRRGCQGQLEQNNNEALQRDPAEPDPEKNMLELVSYGLTGLATSVVVAFCAAYREELSLVLELRSIVMDKEYWLLSRQSSERSAGGVYSGLPNESARREGFRG